MKCPNDMKLILIIVLICFHAVVCAKNESDRLSRKAMLFFELKTILETDGLSSRMTEDGDVSFVYKGNLYLLELTEDNHFLYYGRLSRFHKYGAEITRDAINLFNREINYKLVKVLGTKTGYYLRTEFLIKDSQYFKQTYSRFVELLDQSYRTLLNKAPGLAKNIGNETFEITGLKILTEKTDSISFIHPIATFSAPARGDKKYSVFIRLYRNNTLMQDGLSPEDYSYTDTLQTKTQDRPFWLKPWPYNYCDTITLYRCELWYENKCLAASSFKVD